MPQEFVLLGDPTSHGGIVLTASSTTIVDGRAVALVGDLVSCPIPGHGINPILIGCSDWSEDGRAMVVTGCLCACGCIVISTITDCVVN